MSHKMSDSRLTSEQKQQSSVTVGGAQAPSPLHTPTDTQQHSAAPVQRKFHCRWYFLNYIQSELEGKAVKEREEPHTPPQPTECASADVFRTPDRPSTGSVNTSMIPGRKSAVSRRPSNVPTMSRERFLQLAEGDDPL
ncbi:hypothetical protein [Echinococcus multilocularis]|uniref:Uncharacterized protein n=1 Tax=Echinococcus multilocularis TaxID=6211 RepID=A0A068Y827_ECHMU|nr:hypothetical protein [Echinococcus multilocularis]